MSQYFTHYSDVPLSLLGFGLFFAVFIGSLLWTAHPENKKIYKHIANHILKDGE